MLKKTLLAVSLSSALLAAPMVGSAAPVSFTSYNNTNGYTNVSIDGSQSPIGVTDPAKESNGQRTPGKKVLGWGLVELACHHPANNICTAYVVINANANGSGGTLLSTPMSINLSTGVVTPAVINDTTSNGNKYTVQVIYDANNNPLSHVSCVTSAGNYC